LTGGNAGVDLRNKLVTSVAAGVGLLNLSLDELQNFGIKPDCLNGLIGVPDGGYKISTGQQIRLWGFTISMLAGHERYRPQFLAAEMANQVMYSNLVDTKQSGGHPVFSAAGKYDSGKPSTVDGVPSLYTYGFSEDKKRSLILINVDVERK